MDFKVAGTADFVTALQLDTKIDGLPADVLAEALHQAHEARLQILEVMRRGDRRAPGRGGRHRTEDRQLRDPDGQDRRGDRAQGQGHQRHPTETGADISVDDDGMVGTVIIGSTDKGAVDEARRQIKLILNPPTAEVGQIYTGRVVNITKFGAFVNILPGRDGLLHISKIGGGKRIDKVEDVLDLGDEVEVRVDDVDPSGKVSLSLATAPDARWRWLRRGWFGRVERDPGRPPRATASRSASRTRSTPSCAPSSATSDRRGRLSPPVIAATAATGVAAATAATATEVVVAAGAASLPRFPEVPSHVTSAASTEEIRETRLANGIRVVTEHMPEARSVTLGFWVGVGGRDEPDELAGASHFLEHLLFKGTRRARPARSPRRSTPWAAR